MTEHHLDGEPVTGHSTGPLGITPDPVPVTSPCGRQPVQGITMNESEGWIKLHRKITHSICWTYSGPMRLVWITLLLKANHAEGWWHGVKLMPGQCATSVAHVARDAMVTGKQARTCLRLLSEWGQVKCENVANQWTKVTLCNWATYQESGQTKGQAEGKPRANEGQAEGNKQEEEEQKECKNEEKLEVGGNGIVELVSKVKACRREFASLPDVGFQNALKAGHRSVWVRAVDEFCRDMTNAMELPRIPSKALAGYVGKLSYPAAGSVSTRKPGPYATGPRKMTSREFEAEMRRKEIDWEAKQKTSGKPTT